MLVGVRVGPGSPAVLLVVGRDRRIPDWPYDLAVSVAHRAWTRVIWSRMVQVHGLVGLCTCWHASLCPWWKVPVDMQPKFQQSLPIDRQWMVPFTFVDRVLDIACMLQRQIRTVHFVQKTGESTAQVLGRSCYRARCCERQERMGPDSAETVWKCRKCSFLWLWTSL